MVSWNPLFQWDVRRTGHTSHPHMLHHANTEMTKGPWLFIGTHFYWILLLFLAGEHPKNCDLWKPAYELWYSGLHDWHARCKCKNHTLKPWFTNRRTTLDATWNMSRNIDFRRQVSTLTLCCEILTCIVIEGNISTHNAQRQGEKRMKLSDLTICKVTKSETLIERILMSLSLGVLG